MRALNLLNKKIIYEKVIKINTINFVYYFKRL